MSDLVQIAASEADGAGEALLRGLRSAIPQIRSGLWRLRSWRIRAVERPRRKVIVFARMVYVARRRTTSAEIVAKFYGSDGGARALEALRRLRAAGFGPPSAHRVPRPYGYSSDLGVLVESAVDGTTWLKHLSGGDEAALASAARRAASWLLRLQAARVRAPAVDHDVVAAAAEWRASALAAIDPAHARRFGALGAGTTRLLRTGVAPPVPSHGDFHARNVLFSGRVTTAVDLDTFALREPAFDVGAAIGHLLIMSRRDSGSFAAGARAAQAFWRRYERDGAASWSRAAAHVARTLLHHLYYELCMLRSGRVELAEAWCDAMEAILSTQDARSLEALAA